MITEELLESIKDEIRKTQLEPSDGMVFLELEFDNIYIDFNYNYFDETLEMSLFVDEKELDDNDFVELSDWLFMYLEGYIAAWYYESEARAQQDEHERWLWFNR